MTAAAVAALAAAAPAAAAPGDLVRTFNVLPKPVCGTSAGIAFDGSELLLSCAQTDVVTRVNPETGAVMGSITVAGLPAGEGIGAMSWDGDHHLLWVGTTHFQPHI